MLLPLAVLAARVKQTVRLFVALHLHVVDDEVPVPVESRQIDGFRLIQRRLLHRLAVARDGHRVMALIRFQIVAPLILAQIGFQVQQTIRRIVLHGVFARHPRLTARLDDDSPVGRLGKTVGYARFLHRIGIRGQINRGRFSVFDLHRVGAAVLRGQRKLRGKAGVCILRAVRRIEHLFEDKPAVLRVVILELGFHCVFFRSGLHRHKLIRIERLADFDLLVARLDVGIARFHPRAHHIVVAFGQFPARLKRADPVGKLRVLAKHQLVLFVARHFASLINRKDRVAARIGRSVRRICRQLHILFRQDVAALTHEMIIQRFAAVGLLFIAVAVNRVVQRRIQRDAQALKGGVIQPFVVAVQLKVRPVIDQVDRVIVVRIDRRMNGIIAVQRRRVVDRVFSLVCGHYEAARAIPVFHNIAGVGAVSKCHCGLLRIDLRVILSRNRLNRFLERIAGKIEHAIIHVVDVLAQNLALRSQRARVHLIGEGYLVAVYRVPHGLVLHIPRLCFCRIPEGVRVDRCPIVNRRTGVNFLFAVFVIVMHLRRDRRGE